MRLLRGAKYSTLHRIVRQQAAWPMIERQQATWPMIERQQAAWPMIERQQAAWPINQQPRHARLRAKYSIHMFAPPNTEILGVNN